MTDYKLPDYFSNDKLSEYKSDIRNNYETDHDIVSAVKNHELFGEFERVHQEIVDHLLSLRMISICISEAVDACVDESAEGSMSSAELSYAWRIRRMGRYFLTLLKKMEAAKL